VTQRGPWIRFVGWWLPDGKLTQNAAVIVLRVLEADGLSVAASHIVGLGN
jgi:hypothetical protein